MSLIPLVGGIAGMFFAVILGYVTTKKAGTPFAMITLGIGELVTAMSLMIPEFFGGEGGVSANRTVGKAFMGITYGPQIQVYYLLAVYTLICTAAMYAFTRTPLGRMLNAVRDNPERVEFIGYSMQRVRYLSFIIAGFFAGVAGGMYALNFEIATAEVVGAGRSGAYLLFTFLGGATFFFGPIIGGVLMILGFALFSELTKAWQLYLGLIFLFMVMYAPGGIASLIMMNVRVAAYKKLHRLWGWYAALTATALVMLVGAAALVELVYHLQLAATTGSTLHYLGLTLDTHQRVELARCARRHADRLRRVRVRAAPLRPRVGPDPGRDRGHDVVQGAERRHPRGRRSGGARSQHGRAMSEPTPAVELKDLRKSFGKTEIIRGTDLAVAPGERVAIIGPNGAGKSTLFNLISGRFGPTSGEILLNGKRIDGLQAVRDQPPRAWRGASRSPTSSGACRCSRTCAAACCGRWATATRSGNSWPT